MAVWMLPEGVEELLPPAAWRLEMLRRRLLDHYRDAGYAFILPPLVEHLDSLLTGAGSALKHQTFALTDPASGRLLGVRADMTPQAARIAARHFSEHEQVRLCYLGSVLRTRADAIGAPRGLIQVGCELFGDISLAGDIEVLRLMLQTLALAEVRGVHLDLGHVGISRAVVAQAQLTPEQEDVLFDILQRKSAPDFVAFADARGFAPAVRDALAALMALHGDSSVLAQAQAQLGHLGAEVGAALNDLREVTAAIASEFAEVPMHIDLAELRGYRYHTGLVFAAYAEGAGREIARAGRYDGTGGEYGRPRPATGFSADLNELMRLGN